MKISELPAAGPQDGTESIPEVQDGVTKDVPLSSLSFASTQITYTLGYAGAVTRTVQARLRDGANVKDFGAQGGAAWEGDKLTAAQATGLMIAVTGGVFNFGSAQNYWDAKFRTVQAGAPVNDIHGSRVKITNPTTSGGYGIASEEYDNTGDIGGSSNDIGRAILIRHRSITLGASWGWWPVSASPLNPNSGYATAPTAPQSFAMVMSEANPISRHSDCGIAFDARHWVNWHAGHDVVPETKDFWNELGGGRAGYSIPFFYGISKSPQTNSDQQRHARGYFGLFGRPNVIEVGGAFLYCTGYVDRVEAVTIVSGGSLYQVGDIVTLNSGLSIVSNKDSSIRVKAVDAGGAITSAEVYTEGYYNQPFATTVPVTGGHGSGATFTYQLSTTASQPRAYAGIAGRWASFLDASKWSTAGSYTGAAIFSRAMFVAPNNQKIVVARNAADTADVDVLKVNLNDQVELADQPIIPSTSFVPTVTPDTGTCLFALVEAHYSRINGRVSGSVTFQITDAQTAAGGLLVALPVPTIRTFVAMAMNATDGTPLCALCNAGGGGKIRLTLATGGNVAVTGKFYTLTFSYEVAP